MVAIGKITMLDLSLRGVRLPMFMKIERILG